ncbi:glycosyltransferase family 2 protein [Candidatus Woesearchaeota archaeon]|nr:glycosyltransferase family 2 protein [Candidatus Woesearchaeota archaeon]
MKKNKKISLVIPTLNEEKNIAFLLKKIPGYIDEIIIVDGYSRDRTVAVAKKFNCRMFFDKFGKGSAITKGIKKSKGDFIIIMDADLSHKTDEINLLINGLLKGYDVTMGSRFIKGGGSRDISFIRVMGNKFFVILVNFLFRAKYTDLCYGYRAFKRESVNVLNLKSKGFSIETEISIKCAKKKLKVLEIPSFEKKRRFGKGKLRAIEDGLKIMETIIKEVVNR